MSEKTKPHHFGSARELTPEEKEVVDAAFLNSVKKIEPPIVNQLKTRIARLEEKEAEFDIIYIALFNLVNLKSHKDTFGKTNFYQNQQPFCWQSAKDALAGKLAKQSLAEIEAQAVEVYGKECERLWGDGTIAPTPEEYAANLREGK